MFCELKLDQKTFMHFKQYLIAIHNGDIDTQLDNRIQAFEMIEHLNKKNFCTDRQVEIANWVNENAIGMRVYINTLKFLCITFEEFDVDVNNITFKIFEKYAKKLNELGLDEKIHIYKESGLKKENEELRNINMKLKENLSDVIEANLQFKEANEDLKEEIDLLREENEKLRQENINLLSYTICRGDDDR